MVLKFTGKVRESQQGRDGRTRAPNLPGAGRQLRAVLLALLAALSGAHSAATQTNATGEYQVKAAFLFHFAQFVEWPEGTFHEDGSPLVYCTIGEDPFQGALDAALSGKTIAGRPLRVRHLSRPQELQGCQVVFIGEKEKKLLVPVLAALQGNAVLVVGESEQFTEQGGMIGFGLEENKIRFDINLEAAEKARLRISSKLLALAKNVTRGQRGT